MTIGSDIFQVIRKIFVLSDDVARLTAETQQLGRTVHDHEVRLAVIENTLTLTRRPSNLILPGN